MNTKVTIYIPNHNYNKYFKEAIESVVHQTYDNWELFLIIDVAIYFYLLFHFGMEMEADAATDCWSGNLDELAIWRRELSAQEINALHNNGVGIRLRPPTQGDVLSATNTLEDKDGLPAADQISYQWKHDGESDVELVMSPVGHLLKMPHYFLPQTISKFFLAPAMTFQVGKIQL